MLEHVAAFGGLDAAPWQGKSNIIEKDYKTTNPETSVLAHNVRRLGWARLVRERLGGTRPYIVQF
jgi:hypothetical protein